MRNTLRAPTSQKKEVLWSFLLYFIPRISFSLPVLTLTEQECNKIMSPALMAALPKLHLNRHTARSILYGPELYGGLNLPNAYLLQSKGQILLLLGHLRAQDKTGINSYLHETFTNIS